MSEFHSLEEAKAFIQTKELQSGVRFASYKSTKHLGIQEAKKIYYSDKASVKRGRLEDTGIPFAVLGRKRLDCQFGKNRKKDKRHEVREDDHDRYRKGKKFLLTTTKKLGCPASCLIREICRFPTYKLMPEPIDTSLSSTIKKLVGDGISSPSLVRNHLKQIVRDTVSPDPNPSNRRFFPSLKRIRNLIYKASGEKVVEDQDYLREWYGPKFIFAYQSKEPRRLLERYGSTVFLDATYKTTIYDLSLFFMVAKTNVDYQVVGAFVVEDEQSDSIINALTVMKDSCFTRVLSYFLTDFNEAEIHALETIFPGTRRGKDGLQKRKTQWMKNQILQWLYRLANSFNEEEFSTVVNEFYETDTWKQNIRLQQYLNRVWFPQRKRWSRAFRRGGKELVAGTNNEIEIQHRLFKTNFLHKKTNKSFFAMIKILIEDFFPNKYLGYREANAQCSGEFGVFNPDIPAVLHKRPRKFIKHCLEEIDASFDIKSLNKEVSLGDANTLPECYCIGWEKTLMPCRHMFFSILEDNVVQMDKLSPLYLASVYCTIDDSIENDTDGKNTSGPVTDSQEHQSGKSSSTVLVTEDSQDYDNEKKYHRSSYGRWEANPNIAYGDKHFETVCTGSVYEFQIPRTIMESFMTLFIQKIGAYYKQHQNFVLILKSNKMTLLYQHHSYQN